MRHTLGMHFSPGGRGYQWANRLAWCAGFYAAFIAFSLLSPWYVGLTVAIIAIWVTTALSGLIWFNVREILACDEPFHRTKSGVILAVAIPVGLLALVVIPNWHDFDIDGHPSLVAVAGSVLIGFVSFIYGAGIITIIGTATSWFMERRKFPVPSVNPIEEHSRKIFRKATEGVDAIRQFSEGESIDQSKHGLTQAEWIAVFCEFMNFYLHLTDRFVIGNIIETRRSEVMTELESLTIDTSAIVICEGWPPDLVDKVKKEWWDNFQVSMQDYGQYKKMLPEKGGAIKDTLFWEFGKRIADLSGNDKDIAYIVLAADLAINSLKELGMKAFVEKIKDL